MLRPTEDEIEERVEVYLRLLEHPAHPAVDLAIRMLSKLQRAGRLDGRAVLARIQTAVGLRSAKTAGRAIQLIGQVMDHNPALATDGLREVMLGLRHDAGEVQDAALAVIERHEPLLDEQGRSDLAAAIPLLDPGLRDRVSPLRGARDRASSDETSPRGEATATVVTSPASRSDPERIVPVESVEELLELTAVVLERQDDPDQLERWCDGVSRLCDQPIDEPRRRALLRRARRIIGPPTSFRDNATALAGVCVVAHGWLAGTRIGSI